MLEAEQEIADPDVNLSNISVVAVGAEGAFFLYEWLQLAANPLTGNLAAKKENIIKIEADLWLDSLETLRTYYSQI